MYENNYCQSAFIPTVKYLESAKFLLVAALGLIPFYLNQFLWPLAQESAIQDKRRAIQSF